MTIETATALFIAGSISTVFFVTYLLVIRYKLRTIAKFIEKNGKTRSAKVSASLLLNNINGYHCLDKYFKPKHRKRYKLLRDGYATSVILSLISVVIMGSFGLTTLCKKKKIAKIQEYQQIKTELVQPHNQREIEELKALNDRAVAALTVTIKRISEKEKRKKEREKDLKKEIEILEVRWNDEETIFKAKHIFVGGGDDPRRIYTYDSQDSVDNKLPRTTVFYGGTFIRRIQ